MKQIIIAVVLLCIPVISVAQASGGVGVQKAAPAPGVVTFEHPSANGDVTYYRNPGEIKWWKDSEVVKKVQITDSQIAQIEQVFVSYRVRLIDLNAELERQEARLEPLIEADQPDEVAVTSQIDSVAQARAELEKANALMALGMRRVLTADQWKRLQTVQNSPITWTRPVKILIPEAPR
jgi:Spy/CpxP family protein refolding chaperone